MNTTENQVITELTAYDPGDIRNKSLKKRVIRLALKERDRNRSGKQYTINSAGVIAVPKSSGKILETGALSNSRTGHSEVLGLVNLLKELGAERQDNESDYNFVSSNITLLKNYKLVIFTERFTCEPDPIRDKGQDGFFVVYY